MPYCDYCHLYMDLLKEINKNKDDEIVDVVLSNDLYHIYNINQQLGKVISVTKGLTLNDLITELEKLTKLTK